MANPFTPEIVGWAQAGQRVYQVPTSLNLAVAMVESTLGLHTPPGSNDWHGFQGGGVVAASHEQTASGVSYPTQESFLVFAVPAGSFMHFAFLLGLGKPYHDMVTTFLKSPRGPADVRTLARSLTGVYARTFKPKPYGEVLVDVMDQYNLDQYDALPSTAASVQPTETIPMTTTSSAATPATPAPTQATIAPATVPPIVAPATATKSVTQTALEVGDALETLLTLANAAAQAAVPAAIALLPAPLNIVASFFAPTVIQGYINTACQQLEASAQGKTVEVDTSNAVVAMVVQALNANEPWLVAELKNLEALVQPLVTNFLVSKPATTAPATAA